MFRMALLAIALVPSSPTPMTTVGGHWIALVTDTGDIAVVDLESGVRKEWTPPAPAVSVLAFDPGGDAEKAGDGSPDGPPALVLATPGASGTSSALFLARS